jgi:hypothetical protein
MSVHGENGPKNRISSPGGKYSCSVRYFDVVHKILGVLKNIKIWKKISLWFYRQTSVHSENWPKICISSLFGLYYVAVKCFISSFSSKSKGVSIWFYWQMSIYGKNGTKIYILSPWGPYPCLVRHYGGVNIFWGFKRYGVSTQNPKGLTFGFTDKHLFIAKTGWKYEFHPRETHILFGLDFLVMYIKF